MIKLLLELKPPQVLTNVGHVTGLGLVMIFISTPGKCKYLIFIFVHVSLKCRK
jgi:hypothetical protein